MFNYQLKKVDGNVNKCGFPETSLNKVISGLENKHINYKVIDKSNEYNIEMTEEYKNNNMYDEMYSKANKYMTKKGKINDIYTYLMENINNNEISQKVEEVEKIIYEI